LKKRCGKWVGQWWESGHRRNRALGPVSSLTKSDARKKLNGILSDLTQSGDAITTNSGSIHRDELQTFLDAKAGELSFSMTDHLGWDLKQLFDMAIAEDLRNLASKRRIQQL
jgi:hypothetical protein